MRVDKRAINRLENVRALIASRGGTKAFAAAIGKPKGMSWVSQMTGPNPSRHISTDTAREWERVLGLREGSLDWKGGEEPLPMVHIPPAPQPAAPAPAARHKARGNGHTAESTQQPATVIAEGATDVAVIVNMLLAVWSEEKIKPPMNKFGDCAAFAISEAVETGHAPTPATLKRLISLLR